MALRPVVLSICDPYNVTKKSTSHHLYVRQQGLEYKKFVSVIIDVGGTFN